MELTDWQGAPPPGRVTLEGRYTRLEPLDAARHLESLQDMARQPGGEDRFRYLFETVPETRADFQQWFDRAAASSDPLFHAVVDRATGRAEGRQALMRIEPKHGVIEIGSILWGPAIARSRVATEALYLAARHVFELGYRRLEWKCNDLNEPSKNAALRFGFRFEGLFRQHMVVKGHNRDTAWFAMLDRDWPRLKDGYDRWLRPENFGPDGAQRSRLSFAESDAD